MTQYFHGSHLRCKLFNRKQVLDWKEKYQGSCIFFCRNQIWEWFWTNFVF